MAADSAAAKALARAPQGDEKPPGKPRAIGEVEKDN